MYDPLSLLEKREPLQRQRLQGPPLHFLEELANLFANRAVNAGVGHGRFPPQQMLVLSLQAREAMALQSVVLDITVILIGENWRVNPRELSRMRKNRLTCEKPACAPGIPGEEFHGRSRSFPAQPVFGPDVYAGFREHGLPLDFYCAAPISLVHEAPDRGRRPVNGPDRVRGSCGTLTGVNARRSTSWKSLPTCLRIVP